MSKTIDVIGRCVTWKPENCDRLFGRVCKIEPYTVRVPNVPSQCLGSRQILTKIHVEMADGRVMVLDRDAQKRYGVIAE